MATIEELINSLYSKMKENISFIDYKFKNVKGKTDLYKYLENHENETIIKPDFLENIDFKEFCFEGIRNLKLNQCFEKVRRAEGNNRGSHYYQAIDEYNISFSVYFSIKKNNK